MKPRLLFPSKLKYLGYLLAIPGFILGYISKNHDILSDSYSDELALSMVIIGLLFIAFSKVKCEDELTARIRIHALYWAILINYILFSLVILFITICNVLNIKVGDSIFGSDVYLISFSIYNLFTPLVIFIAIFYYQLFRNKNEFLIKPIKYLPSKPYSYLGKWLSIIFFSIIVINQITNFNEDIKVLAFLLPLTLLTWAYSKEKNEDEYIAELRLEAMQIAIYVNYTILLLSNILFYGLDFWIVLNLNLITIPLIFIAWFQYKLYCINKQINTKSIAS